MMPVIAGSIYSGRLSGAENAAANMYNISQPNMKS